MAVLPAQPMPSWLLYVAAFMFNVPLVIGVAYDYPISLSFLFAPVMTVAVLRALTSPAMRLEAVLFVLAGLIGVAICLVQQARQPDGSLLQHLLSLTLILFSVGFLFMGQWAARSRDSILPAFAFAAAIALILTAAPNIAWQAPVFHKPDGYAHLNVSFLGLPLFGTLGVLNLAHLWCLQVLLCMMGAELTTHCASRLLFFMGVAAGFFLILGSESRGAQLCLAGMLSVALWYGVRHARIRGLFLPVVCAAAIGFGCFSQLPVQWKRMDETIVMLRDGTNHEHLERGMVLFTGRDQILAQTLAGLQQNPFIGTAFRGSMETAKQREPDARSRNTTTHTYYLTLLWKGGIAFALPLFVLLAMQASKLWTTLRAGHGTAEFFAVMALGMMFGLLALTWDILMVPTTGAYSYFLLGLITQRRSA